MDTLTEIERQALERSGLSEIAAELTPTGVSTLEMDEPGLTVTDTPTKPATEEEIETARELLRLLELDDKANWLIQPDRPIIQGIFARRTSMFARYRVTAQFRDKIMGGTPSNPNVLEKHTGVVLGLSQNDQVRIAARKFAMAAGVEPTTNEEALFQLAKDVAGKTSRNSFFRDKDGLYIPTRYVKAMLKEAVNVAYVGKKFGITKKGVKNALSETVFVEGERIHLGRAEPDGLELIIGHVNGPQGPRSTLAHHDFCDQPEIEFTVKSYQDRFSLDNWYAILELAQELGLGACRSQGWGRFEVMSFDLLSEAGKMPKLLGEKEEAAVA